MRNLIILTVAFGAVGLVVGYLVFGRLGITNDLVPLRDLFFSGSSGSRGVVQQAVRSIVDQVAGFADMRRSIYISGGVGAAVGVVVGVLSRRRK